MALTDTQQDDLYKDVQGIVETLRTLSFGLVPPGAQPYSSRGEIATRLRSTDLHTVGLPAKLDAVATDVDALPTLAQIVATVTVGAVDVEALAAALAPLLSLPVVLEGHAGAPPQI
jgi:hypothetical protein